MKMKVTMMDKNEILTKLDKKSFYKTFVPSLKDNGKLQSTGICPFHYDKHHPLSVNSLIGKPLVLPVRLSKVLPSSHPFMGCVMTSLIYIENGFRQRYYVTNANLYKIRRY